MKSKLVHYAVAIIITLWATQLCAGDVADRTDAAWKLKTARMVLRALVDPNDTAGRKYIEDSFHGKRADSYEAEIVRMITRKIWMSRKRAKLIEQCAASYINEKKQQYYNGSLNEKKYRQAEENFKRAMQLSGDWYHKELSQLDKLHISDAEIDPLNKAEHDASKICRMLMKEFEAKEAAAETSILSLWMNEIFRPKSYRTPKSNEVMAWRFLAGGLEKATVEIPKDIYGRVKTAELIIRGDPDAREAWADHFKTLGTAAAEFARHPRKSMRAIGNAMVSADIETCGAAYWIIAASVLTDRAAAVLIDEIKTASQAAKAVDKAEDIAARIEKNESKLARTTLELQEQILRHKEGKITALSEKIAVLKKDVCTDAMTRVYNRRFLEFLEAGEIDMPALTNVENMCAVYIDADFFSAFNELLGHAAGDEMIRAIADGMRTALKKVASRLRNTDAVIRMGGEEFVVLLPETDIEGAKHVAGVIRELVINSEKRAVLIEEMAKKFPSASRDSLAKAFARNSGEIPDLNKIGDLSIGIAKGKKGESLTELIDRADKASAEAKRGLEKIVTY